MTLRYPELKAVRNEIQSEVDGYIHAITILPSLREHFRNMQIECYIEKEIKRRNGYPKTPDLLIHATNYLIVDHKYTKSKDEKTLSNKLEEMREYDATFIFCDTKSKREEEFEPEVIMLTPEETVKSFTRFLNCPITWGYTLNEEIIIKQRFGTVEDSKIASLFTPVLLCSKAEEISKYKFITSHPPLPYTATQVYTILWTLSPPTQYFTPEFKVKYDDILDVFNNLFPPWIGPEIRQLNVRRLREALIFLQELRMIKWFESEKIVIVYRGKGRLIADLFSYLVDHYVKMEHAKRVKEYERKVKDLKIVEKPAGQKKISDFFHQERLQ